MKKPAIIDPTIEVRIYSHAMMTSPHKVEEFNPNKETEVLYARAMELISDGKPLEGKKFLEEAYDLGSFKAGKTLSYGLSVGGSVNVITSQVSSFYGTWWREDTQAQ